MADTFFEHRKTPIQADWLNDVNDTVYGLAAPGGAATVGANDGAGGTLFTTVAGFLNRITATGRAVLEAADPAAARTALQVQNYTGAVSGTVGTNVTSMTGGVRTYIATRIGDVVNWSFTLELTLSSTVAGTNTNFKVNLPEASNFSLSTNLIGVGIVSRPGSANNVSSVFISADPTTDQLLGSFAVPTGLTNPVTVNVVCQYRVI
jgi:hypothetical protein